MAPRRGHDEYTRQSYRHSSRTKTSPTHEKRTRPNPTVFEDDGDVLMTGCRIPTIISSKGAIQNKLDRYAPHKSQVSTRVARQTPDKGHGHKRHGGRYDEPRHYHESRFEPRSVDEHDQRYSSEYKRHWSHRTDDHHYLNHERSSRCDRYAREYHHAVTSSRSRYEHDRARYHSHFSSTRDDRHGRRYDSTEYRRSSRYPNEYSSSHSYRRANSGRSHTFPSRDYNVRGEAYWTSHTSDRSQEWAHGRGSYEKLNHRPNPGFGGGFGGAMRSLVSHAAKFLRDIHWQDRSEIEAAVWKAYGDSIASLGYRKSGGLLENRPRGWVSVDEITNRGDGFPFRVPRGPKTMPEYRDEMIGSRHSNVPHRNRVLENYRKANKDYERTLNDLFGGKSLGGTAFDGFNAGSSYTRSYPNAHLTRGGFSESSHSGSRTYSQSILPGSTTTTNRIQQDVPRPKPPVYQTPVYIQDSKDPTRFLNVPRPRMREQWHIPADLYNGDAWADNRKREIESGVFSEIYPDKWFSGDSFGNTTKDSEFREQQIRGGDTQEEAIGRDCYTQDTSLSPVDARFRSRSLTSELGHEFNAIRLYSAPPPTSGSSRGSSRACSELPEDFDLYGPSMSSITSLNKGQIDQDGDGSMTPRQHTPPSERSISLNLMSKGDNIGDGTATDNYYQSSREATPTLLLAEIGYIPSTPISPLKNNINQGSLIDLAPSVPPSPNVTRSDAATPSYYSKANYSLRSPNEPREPQPKQYKIYHKALVDEDWDSSFHSAPNYSKENPVFIIDDEEMETYDGSGIKGGMLVDLDSSTIRLDAETDEDLDFLGVEFFSK